jgi:hypothetical protein
MPHLPSWTRPWADPGRDLFNVVRYGRDAPKTDELLWVDPAAITRTLHAFRARSAKVVTAWPPTEVWPLADHVHVQFAMAHWRDGQPWEATGVYEYMQERIERRGRQDGCRTMDDVVRRYAHLDEVFETVARERRLRTRAELDPAAHREDGGIFVHIAPDGEPIIGESGKHRLTIAQLLELPIIPVRVGLVHRDAIRLLPAMRRAGSAS